MWDIYYHLYLDEPTAAAIQQQAEKLVPLLDTLQSWSDSKYGKTLKFCDVDTLRDVRRVCQMVAACAGNGCSRDRRDEFTESLNTTRAFFDNDADIAGVTMLGMRSTAPLSLRSKMDLPDAHRQYWKDGTVTPKGKGVDIPNPMFSSLVSETGLLHYGTDPVLGYHLATAYAPLVANSPLKPTDEKGPFKVASAAQAQFAEWVPALRDLLGKGSVVRTVVADAFAFCHSLQHASSSTQSANWFRRKLDSKLLSLDSGVYGKGKTGPMFFDMIDTSNLSDHLGALNILVSTAPLLTSRPWATVYTETLKRTGTPQEAFRTLLCGHATTVSLLLGISPIQFWTNAKAESHVDEIFTGLMDQKKQSGEHQILSRLGWKRDDHFSGQPDNRGSLRIDPKTLSRILFDVYLEMFKEERLDTSFQRMNMESAVYPCFHRGSFAVFLKFVKHRVATDWEAVCGDLLDKIATDRTLGLSSNYIQELTAHLYMLDVVVEPLILNEVNQRPETGILRGWRNIPPVVAVTLVVPRRTILRVYEGSREAKMAAPTLVGSLKPSPGASSQWHNMYGNVQLAFGDLKAARSTRAEDLRLSIDQDRLGWEGSSPLVASFYVPTAALQVEPEKTLVGLYVTPSPQSMRLYAPVLGLEMKIFEAGVLEESKVFVSKLIPGQTAYPSYCRGVGALKDVIEGDHGGTNSTMVADVPASECHIGTLTGHLDIVSDKGKKLLKEKVPIEIRQTNPFIIDIVFGNNILSYGLKFPAPVSKEGSRTRVARASGYIEVIAALADPTSAECLADFVFPTAIFSSRVPVALNMPHVNLDRLAALDVEKKDDMRWLATLVSLHFSKRETKKREEIEKSGISKDPRVNFKESVFTMFMLASGLQGGETGLFAISHPGRGGIHMLVVVSAIRLDGDTASAVLDAAILPLTTDLVTSGKIEEFLLMLRSLECATITVNDAELALWKKVLPSMVERCRTWSHRGDCEYRKKGATVPLSLEDGKQLLCSCGNGQLPDNFVGLPEWDSAAPNAVRAAISPTFAVPFVEEIVDTSILGDSGLPTATGDRCRKCGKRSAADGGALKRCQRCREVKYCSVECQKKDWKTHRMECNEPE